MADCIAPSYLPASYNGVFFECLIAGSEHGRRQTTGEFPFGEQTAYKDMGIKIRHFSISGRFQGPDCVTQTSALIAAVETPGPGTLIHPARGTLTVGCTALKIKDDIVQAAGETTFDMEFVDAGNFTPQLGSLPIIPSVSDFITNILNSFSDNYTPQSLMFFKFLLFKQSLKMLLLLYQRRSFKLFLVILQIHQYGRHYQPFKQLLPILQLG